MYSDIVGQGERGVQCPSRLGREVYSDLVDQGESQLR